MEYKKAIFLIIIVDLLILVLFALISFRFLSSQVAKTKEKRPEIMAQYNVSLEVSKFLKLKKKLNLN